LVSTGCCNEEIVESFGAGTEAKSGRAGSIPGLLLVPVAFAVLVRPAPCP